MVRGRSLVLAMEEELDSDPKGRAAFPHLVGDLHGVEDERPPQSCRGSQCVFPPGIGRSTTGDTGHQLERRESPSRQHGDLGERRGGPDPPQEQTCCGFPPPPADCPPLAAWAWGVRGYPGLHGDRRLSPRRPPFSAAAGEQPQPARRHRHRGTGTEARERAGAPREGRGQTPPAPFPAGSPPPARMSAMQPPEPGRAGGGEYRHLIYLILSPKCPSPRPRPLFHPPSLSPRRLPAARQRGGWPHHAVPPCPLVIAPEMPARTPPSTRHPPGGSAASCFPLLTFHLALETACDSSAIGHPPLANAARRCSPKR